MKALRSNLRATKTNIVCSVRVNNISSQSFVPTQNQQKEIAPRGIGPLPLSQRRLMQFVQAPGERLALGIYVPCENGNKGRQ